MADPAPGPGRALPLRRVLFLSQRRAEAMRPPRRAALVSITDTAAAPAVIRDGWQAVLRVAFDDKDPVHFPDDYEDLQEISAAQAAAIAAFVADQQRHCTRLVVHCHYGVSRSAAVAKAVAESAGLPFPQDYADHNDYVYQALRRALAAAAGSTACDR